MKRCARCGNSKPLEEFHRDKNRKDGHYAYCKVCTLSKQSESYHNDVTASRERKRRANIKWRANNPERCSELRRISRDRNLDAERLRCRTWAKRHPTYSNKRKARSIGSHSEAEWNAIVKKQSGRCAKCQRRVPLTRDHIVPLSRGGSDYAFNIQGLCKSCNCSKHAKMLPGAEYSLFDRL